MNDQDKLSRASTGRNAPADPLESQYSAVRDSAGFRLMDERIVIEIKGDDRASFMHGLCSNDVQGLKPGSVMYSLLLTEHAHLISDFYLWCESDRFLLEIDRSLWARSREHLEKFLVADDVEFEELSDLQLIDLEGPASGEIIGRICDSDGCPPDSWQHTKTRFGLVANLPRLGGSAFTILGDETQARILGAALTAVSVPQVSLDVLEIIRVEQGLTRVGVDAGEKTIALEARFENAISFNKGCYLGQETIERATARGGLKKRLFGLRFSDNTPPGAGSTVMFQGKEVGRVTSVATSPKLGVVGLSILHHSAWKPGTDVTVVSSTNEMRAKVSDLPFAPAG
jgi:folate-binding protein YgfZ